jgi:hypothetical protein
MKTCKELCGSESPSCLEIMRRRRVHTDIHACVFLRRSKSTALLLRCCCFQRILRFHLLLHLLSIALQGQFLNLSRPEPGLLCETFLSFFIAHYLKPQQTTHCFCQTSPLCALRCCKYFRLALRTSWTHTVALLPQTLARSWHSLRHASTVYCEVHPLRHQCGCPKTYLFLVPY